MPCISPLVIASLPRRSLPSPTPNRRRPSHQQIKRSDQRQGDHQHRGLPIKTNGRQIGAPHQEQPEPSETLCQHRVASQAQDWKPKQSQHQKRRHEQPEDRIVELGERGPSDHMPETAKVEVPRWLLAECVNPIQVLPPICLTLFANSQSSIMLPLNAANPPIARSVSARIRIQPPAATPSLGTRIVSQPKG